MDKKYGIFVICAAILVLCFVGTASATTWSVNGSGGADFTEIQEAINNASDGDTILVHSGIYYENVVVNKSVTLKGINLPVVDAGGEGSAITLTADGIMLVGFNATNSGSSWSNVGIKVTSNNNTITSNNVSSNGVGIRLDFSRNNFITGNNVSSNGVGIRLYDSSNNTITDNVFVNDGLSVDGLSLLDSYQNTVEENTVNGKPLVYLEDASDYKVEDAGQVILVNCNNIIVENLDLSNTYTGIYLWETEDSRISNNTVCNNSRDGICLWYSRNNTITRNNVCNNTITGNNARDKYWGGIGLASSNNNTITRNKVCNNNIDGIWLFYSSSNTITRNNVCNNNEGIYIDYSSDNHIYLNNFINNRDNVYSSKSTNIRNSPLEINYTYDGTTYVSYLGNYWGDYVGTDAEGDGIGDTHYSTDSDSDESADYPLMTPFDNYIIPSSAHTQPHTTGFELLFAMIGVVAAVYLVRKRGPQY
jgi:parallel beta-helix repeat protein